MITQRWLRLGCVVLGALLCASAAKATNFAVLLTGGGSQDEDLDCSGVEIGALEFEEPTVEIAPDGTQYTRPGKVKPVRIKLKRGELNDRVGAAPGLETWIKEYDASLRSERTIEVVALKGEKPPRCEGCAPPWLDLAVARYTFAGCEIDGIEETTVANDDGTVSVVQTLTLRTKKPPKIGSVTSGGSAGKPTFRVGIVGPKGVLVEEKLTSWGGGEMARVVSAPFNPTQYHEASPVTVLRDLVLRNEGLPGLPAVYDWLNASIAGDPAPRQVRVTELGANGRRKKGTYIYSDCFPMRYVFPTFSGDAAGSGDGEYLQVRGFKLEINN